MSDNDEVTVLLNAGDGSFDGGTEYAHAFEDDVFFPFMDPLAADLDGDADPDRIRIGDRVVVTENVCE